MPSISGDVSWLGMGIGNRFLFRTGSQWIDSLQSLAKLVNDSANDSMCHCACANVVFLRQSVVSDCRKKMATRQKHSKAWLYFTRQNDNNATCNVCSKCISSTGGNTTNMMKHLKKQHGINLQECRVFNAPCSSSSAANVSASSSQGSNSSKVITTTVWSNLPLLCVVDQVIFCPVVWSIHFCSGIRVPLLITSRFDWNPFWEMFYRNGVS